MRRVGSWALALLAAAALTVSLLALFAGRNVFDADGFADRTEQTLQSDAVSAELARRLTDAALRAQPDLLALRPLVNSAAEGVVRSSAFRSLVRAGACAAPRRCVNTGTITSSPHSLRHRVCRQRPEGESPVTERINRGRKN